MSLHTISPLDRYRSNIVEWVNQGKSDQWIAESLSRVHKVGTTRHSIRRARSRWGLKKIEGVENSSFKLNGDNAEIVGKPSFDASTPDDLLRERGLDPEDWEIRSLSVNEWEALTKVDDVTGLNEVKVLRQLKLSCTRTKPTKIIIPARIPGNYIRPKTKKVNWENGELIVFVGDQQVGGPNNSKLDQRFHELFLEWLAFNKPSRGVQIGDLLDNSETSRHPRNPEWDEKLQECVDAGYLVLRDTVQASEDTEWDFLLGNHDERIRNYILQNSPALYNLRQAKAPEEDPEDTVWGLKNLLRLDELGINLIDPKGNYEFASAKIGNDLAARHGWRVKTGAGKTAIATIEDFDYSIVVGHVHRQAIVHRTSYGIDGQPKIISGMEIGTMATLDENGLGYAVAPNWQNGFGTAILYPDGSHQFQLATYKNKKLYWNEQCFS